MLSHMPSSSHDFVTTYKPYQIEYIPTPPDSPPAEKDANERIPRNMCPALCKVCGGQATGYHYEVPSCNGCKTFFRRTVLSKKVYSCKRVGNCASDLSKKKQHWCRACRFKKCVDAGMNPLAISSQDNPTDNELVKAIIRKRGADPSASSEYDSIPSPLVSAESDLSRLIDGLLYLELKKENFRKCKYNPDPRELPPLVQLIRTSCQMDMADRVGPMPNWPLPTPAPATEQQKASWRKQGIMFRPIEENRKNWLVFDLLTTVEYAKTFPFFHKLDESDRVILLKNVGLICHNLTQAFFSFENKSDAILHPDGTNMVPPSKEAPRYQLIYNIKKKLILPLIRNQLNKKEYVLLKALMLCNSNVSDLSSDGKDILEKERCLINKALLHLSLSERGKDGPARYAANISIVQLLEDLTRQLKDVHLLVRITCQQSILTGLAAELYES